ncbi:hypothetical protein LCGC14_0405010 [marine sediment metagenome]|uniref:Uncharacterized protein n=1 Tax=marine sediment metagenome TaxID=412755 RepID=A0A0F9TDI0_9ZZZZ
MIKKTIEVESRTGIILRKRSFKKGTVCVHEIKGNEFYRFKSGGFIKELSKKEYHYLMGLSKKEVPKETEEKQQPQEAKDIEEPKPKKKGRPKKGDK